MVKSVETENRRVVARHWGGGEEELLFSENSFSFARCKSSGDLLHNNVNLHCPLKKCLVNFIRCGFYYN